MTKPTSATVSSPATTASDGSHEDPSLILGMGEEAAVDAAPAPTPITASMPAPIAPTVEQSGVPQQAIDLSGAAAPAPLPSALAPPPAPSSNTPIAINAAPPQTAPGAITAGGAPRGAAQQLTPTTGNQLPPSMGTPMQAQANAPQVIMPVSVLKQ